MSWTVFCQLAPWTPAPRPTTTSVSQAEEGDEASPCVCEWRLGGQLAAAPASGSPHSSCDWCAPVADRAEARAQGPAEADVYLWSESAAVRGPWSSNILILTNTALGLISSLERAHQVLLLPLTVGLVAAFTIRWSKMPKISFYFGNFLHLHVKFSSLEKCFAVTRPDIAADSRV